MIRKTYSFILFLFCNLTTWAQQTYDLPLAKPVNNDTTNEAWSQQFLLWLQAKGFSEVIIR